MVVSKGSLKYFLLCNSSVLSRFVILYSLKESSVFSPLVDCRSVKISPLILMNWKTGRYH